MQESIALTWFTMTARLKNLRAGATAAGLALAAFLFLAAFLRSGWVWAGLPLLAVIGYAAFLRDQRLVFAWEDRVLALWGKSDLCMGILVQTLATHPSPLGNTLKAMIAHLPENKDYLPPVAGEVETQRNLFWIRTLLTEARLHRAAAFNIACAALPCLFWYCYREGRAWVPLAFAPLALLPLARIAALSAARRRWVRRRAAVGDWKPASAEDFRARLESLDWSGLPGTLKPEIAAAVVEGR